MKSLAKTNLNHCIYFKLTDEGKRSYCEYYNIDDLPEYFKPNDQGFYEKQIWAFMAIFSKNFGLTKNPPCEMEVLIEVEK